MLEKQTVPQQNIQLPPELAQQLNLLTVRVGNANLANADMMKEMDNTFKAMAAIIAALQKENTELKAKTENSKPQ